MSRQSSEHPAATGGGELPAPNHHASHPGFSGVRGLLAGLSFLVGRREAATLAIGLAQLRRGDRLVDVGCGPGLAAHLAHRAGAEVIGVDPAPVMLRVARARWRADRGVGWRAGSAEALPVGDGWAQVVWSLSTVHHWADIGAGLDEVRRVLAPGGRLVVLERGIRDTGARGTASHGWTVEQSESFAEHCRRHGFVDAAAGVHDKRGAALSVVARR